MAKKLYSSEGIVLSRKYFSEADAIVSIFTRDYGKLSFVAKGIKKPKSKKRGYMEPFSIIEFSAVKSHALPIITETQTAHSLDNLRLNLKKVAVAYYFSELVAKSSFDEEENQELYLLIKKYLILLNNSNSLKKLRLDFAQDLLVTLGFWPDGKSLPDTDMNVEEIIEKNLYSLRIGRALVV